MIKENCKRCQSREGKKKITYEKAVRLIKDLLVNLEFKNECVTEQTQGSNPQPTCDLTGD